MPLLASLAELLPDAADRVGRDGSVEKATLDELAPGDVVLVRSLGRSPSRCSSCGGSTSAPALPGR